MVAVDEVKAVVVGRGHDVDVLLGGGFGHDGFAFLWSGKWQRWKMRAQTSGVRESSREAILHKDT